MLHKKSIGDKLIATINKPEADKIAALIVYQLENYKFFEDSKRVLALEEILTLCAAAFNVPAESLKGKIKCKLRSFQLIFIGLAYVYTDNGDRTIAEWLGCQGATGWTGVRYLKDRLNYPTNETGIILQLIYKFEKLSKGRISKNVVPTLDYSSLGKSLYISDAGATFKLDTYQISKIPIRQIEWFYNDNNQCSLAAYTLDGKVCSYVKATTKQEDRHLHLLQQFGYRFIHFKYEEVRKLQNHNPICDRCIKKIGCELINSHLKRYLQGYDGSSSSFGCFQGADNNTIDAQLLHLPFYSPQ